MIRDEDIEEEVGRVHVKRALEADGVKIRDGLVGRSKEDRAAIEHEKEIIEHAKDVASGLMDSADCCDLVFVAKCLD